jgi:squalene-associated FAD-dependent desaturase
VVGAGLAGLAAAVALKEAGCRVELFERSRLLGGRTTSFEVDGVEVDNGQHVFLGCCTAFVDLATRLGLGGRLRLQERFDARVFAPGRPPGRLRAAALPAPWHLAAGFLGYAELGWADRARVARAMLALGSLAGDERPLAGWLRARGQTDAALAAFWEPFFVPALNAPLDRIAVGEAAFIVATAFLSEAGAARFGFLTVPLARLAEAAADRLDAVHLRTAVTGLERSPAGTATGLCTADGRRLGFDAFVLAVPPDRLERLAGGLGLPPLDGYASRPIVDVHLWHDRGALGFDFAALLRSPVQWVFEKAPGYLCCSLSDAGEAVEWPEDRLVDLGWSAVRERVPELAGAHLVRGAATRSPDATYAAPPGVRRPGATTSAPNVAVAGAWTDTGWPDTMESAVRSGRAAAEVLTMAHGPSPLAGEVGRPRPSDPPSGPWPDLLLRQGGGIAGRG